MTPEPTTATTQPSPAKNIQYVPGVCNIGPEEITRRRNIGIIGLLIAIVLFVVLFVTHVSPWWRLFVFLPAAMSASGFLQAYFHFCSGYAQKGLFNLGALGSTQKVSDEASVKKDKQKGMDIMIYSLLVGIVVTVIAVLV